MPDTGSEGEKILHGIAVSPGVCRGKILLLTDSRVDSVPRRTISEEEIPEQIARLQQSVTETRRQLHAVQERVNAGMGAKDASIFDAHLLVLEDPTLLDEVSRFVTEQKVNIEYAFAQVAEKYAQTLEAIGDEYLRERAADMRDVTERLLQNLIGTYQELDLKHLKEPYIIVAYDLAPSRTAMLDKKNVLGFATDVGGKTSHTAIMARSLRIPAVVGLGKASAELKDGQYALLDGYHGQVIINPTDQTLFEYGQLVRRQVSLEEKLRDTIDKPAVTLDGVRLTLSANIEQAEDAEAVKASGAEGVGLYRTEYLFLNCATLPTEDEQYQAYRAVAAALKPAPVIIRTLDLGGDKFMSHLNVPKEMNPFLGYRAIRFCLQEKEVFRAQLRAILRASAEGNIKIMYPMISCLDELVQANALLDTYRDELRKEGVPFDEKMEVGVMIEIPSAALTAEALAKRVQFFSIGTNDLIQYTLAVDRLNEKIAHLYEPTNPSILRLIKMTTDAAHAAGIWVGVCGEMAGDPLMIPLLLGLGVDELSAAPQAVPQIKYLLRRVKMSEAKEIAAAALNSESSTEIMDRSQQLVRSVAPSLFEQ
ncbi:MAG TPA: phosphoenolpyruvate--protein phosphotransferase [Candidatus Limnocylindria bacterium]|nr:phosphoenolpyruvate--protein phosphotransferase [Candidatus Limnocylindria bacterium]